MIRVADGGADVDMREVMAGMVADVKVAAHSSVNEAGVADVERSPQAVKCITALGC